jgi:hypothetical protein
MVLLDPRAEFEDLIWFLDELDLEYPLPALKLELDCAPSCELLLLRVLVRVLVRELPCVFAERLLVLVRRVLLL